MRGAATTRLHWKDRFTWTLPEVEPTTIADGARTLSIGKRNFAIIREHVKDVVSVDDDVLLDTVKFAMYRTKLVIEPTGALGLAALFADKIKPRGPVAVVISGGNLDFSLLCK